MLKHLLGILLSSHLYCSVLNSYVSPVEELRWEINGEIWRGAERDTVRVRRATGWQTESTIAAIRIMWACRRLSQLTNKIIHVKGECLLTFLSEVITSLVVTSPLSKWIRDKRAQLSNVPGLASESPALNFLVLMALCQVPRTSSHTRKLNMDT